MRPLGIPGCKNNYNQKKLFTQLFIAILNKFNIDNILRIGQLKNYQTKMDKINFSTVNT